MLEELDIPSSGIGEYPEELLGSWWHVTFFNDHPTLDGMCGIYFNDKYKSGTIFSSDYILNDYPDLYATWKKTDTDIVYAERMYVRKDLRGSNMGPQFMYYGSLVLKHFGRIVKYNNPLSKYGNDLWENAFDEDPGRENEVLEHITLRDEYFEQPANPSIYFYKRKIIK